MNAVQFSILNWSAWAPGVHDTDQWLEWAKATRAIEASDAAPALKQVPAMLRRRLSRLSKMSLQVVYGCVDDNHQLPTIFASPHGEIHRTKKLLDDIVAGEMISPMGFSLSVHNTASGLYSIASKNRAPSTAIAAGADTLEMAVIEALGRLHKDDQSPVLVVLADEPLPTFYEPYNKVLTLPFALALLLELPERAQTGISVSLESVSSKQAASVSENEPHGLMLLRFLMGDDDKLTTSGERSQWQWSKSNG